MDNNTLGLIIALSSFSSIIIFCGCFKYYRDIFREKNEKNRLNNIRNKFKKSSNRIKPISLIILDEELKDESKLRIPKLIGEENV